MLLASYTYNAQGQRTRKTTSTATTVYHYDTAGNLLAETTGTGTSQRAYAHLDTVPVAQIDRIKSGGTTTDVPTYLYTDHLGTPRLGTNSQGTLVWRNDGDAFGTTAPNEDPDQNRILTKINLRFPGQYYDQESGLHYNWNRYYDPRTGRYITSDPIGLAGGPNSYMYAYNGPLRFVDQTGLAVIGEWWQEPTVENFNIWACDESGGNCSSPGGIQNLITLHFRAEGEIAWSILCTDTCKGETWFSSGSSGKIERYPISISVPTPWCKVLPPGYAKTACQVVAASRAAWNISKYVAEAEKLGRGYYQGIADTYKAMIDPTAWCKAMPRDPGSTLK